MPIIRCSGSAPSLRSNAAVLLAGRVTLVASQFISLALITRLGGLREVGVYVTALAVSTPVIVLANLQLGIDITNRRSGDGSFIDYLLLRMAALTIGLGLLLGVSACVTLPEEAWLVLVAVCLTKAAESLCDLCGAARLRHEDAAAFATSLALRGVTQAVLLGVVYGATRSLPAASFSVCTAWTAIFLVHDLPTSLGANAPVRGELGGLGKIVQIAGRTWPLGFGALVAAMELNIPRYVAASVLGSDEAGRFALAASLTLVAQLVMATAAVVAVPRISRLFANGDSAGMRRLHRRLLGLTLGVGLAQTLLLALAGLPIANLVFGNDGLPSVGTLVAVSIASSLMNLAAVQSTRMRACRAYRLDTWAHAVSLVLSGATVWSITFHLGPTGLVAGLLVGSAGSLLIFTIADRYVTVPSKLPRADKQQAHESTRMRAA